MGANGPASRHSTRRDPAFGRVRVDPGNTAFWEGREYRISYEYSVGGTPLVIRFESPIDFILQTQDLSIDEGNIRFRAYRSTQGSEGGTFDESIPIYGANIMNETPSVPTQISITTGGSFTPDAGQSATETIRVRTANATSQRTTVTGSLGDERGLSPGTYYLEFARIDGTNTATGVFTLEWEERAP